MLVVGFAATTCAQTGREIAQKVKDRPDGDTRRSEMVMTLINKRGAVRERKLISKNRSAHHEYFIDETFECGIELSGTEVKSIRERACQITDTFALIRGGECWLVGLHIHPYSHGGVWNRDPDRRRRLLLHRKEIDFLDGKLRKRGYALVPLELYFNTDGRVKLLLGLGRGKKLYDKREDMAKRDVQREIDRALKERNR